MEVAVVIVGQQNRAVGAERYRGYRDAVRYMGLGEIFERCRVGFHH